MSGSIVKISNLDCPNVISDIFILLKEKNDDHVKNRCNNRLFKNDALPSKIFDFCQQHKLAPEARYFAVELFNRFAQKYLKKYPNRKDKIVYFCSRGAIYMMVCVQIASKMVSHYKSISQRNVMSQIDTARDQKRVTKKEILTTELEILQMVDYDLNFLMPMDFLEILLYYIQLHLESCRPQSLINCRDLADSCLNIQDMVYIRETKILSKCEHYPDVQGNRLLLAVAIICVAVFIVDDELSDIIALYLTEKCGLKHETVQCVSICIIEALTKVDSER